MAEGVETAEQLDFLRAHGCREVQGFLISPPIPAEALRELLLRRDAVDWTHDSPSLRVADRCEDTVSLTWTRYDRRDSRRTGTAANANCGMTQRGPRGLIRRVIHQAQLRVAAGACQR